MPQPLTAADIRRLLELLASELAAQGVVGEICLVGGAVSGAPGVTGVGWAVAAVSPLPSTRASSTMSVA